MTPRRPTRLARPRRKSLPDVVDRLHSDPRCRPRISGCGLCALLLASGCGSSSPPPAATLSLPVIAYQGGPIVAAPEVVTVTFAGDTMAADLQAFGARATSSPWWNAVRGPFCPAAGAPCVGDGPPGVSVEIAGSPAASYTDSDDGDRSTLQRWLESAVAEGAIPRPAASADAHSPSSTIYLLYLPATTTIQYAGLSSCVDGGFDGYHNFLNVGTQVVAYSVVMECPSEPSPFTGIAAPTLLENTTITASHEILEAATDPAATIAYELDWTDRNNRGWMDVEGGGEAADICVDPFGLNQDQTKDGTATVQRIWSNLQAASRLDPCAPIPGGGVYFNASPSQAFFTVDVGRSVTFDVRAFSDGPTSNWTLTAQDWSNSIKTTYLTFSIAGGQTTRDGAQIEVTAGASVRVTATLLADPANLDTGEADGALVSVMGNFDAPSAAHVWPFAVTSTEDAARGIDPTGNGEQVPMHRPRFHRVGGARARRARRAAQSMP